MRTIFKDYYNGGLVWKKWNFFFKASFTQTRMFIKVIGINPFVSLNNVKNY